MNNEVEITEDQVRDFLATPVGMRIIAEYINSGLFVECSGCQDWVPDDETTDMNKYGWLCQECVSEVKSEQESLAQELAQITEEINEEWQIRYCDNGCGYKLPSEYLESETTCGACLNEETIHHNKGDK